MGKYIKTSTEISRTAKLAASPILSKISEIINGYVSIRNFKKQEYIINQFKESSDLLANCDLHDRVLSFWARVRIDYPVFIIISLSFIFITISKSKSLLLFEEISQIGLMISYIIALSNMTGAFVWNLTSFMKEMSSVERI